MALTREFTDAVDAGKKIRVRIMLKDIMLVDPSLNTFNEMLEYAEKNMEDLYDCHDGEELIKDSESWDEEYMNQQMVSVVNNFSKERLDILRKIVRKIYASKIQPEKNVKSTNSTSSSSNPSCNSSFSKVQVAGGVVAIAGVGALIGGIAGSSTSVAVIGGVAIAGGIAMIALGGNKGV